MRAENSCEPVAHVHIISTFDAVRYRAVYSRLLVLLQLVKQPEIPRHCSSNQLQKALGRHRDALTTSSLHLPLLKGLARTCDIASASLHARLRSGGALRPLLPSLFRRSSTTLRDVMLSDLQLTSRPSYRYPPASLLTCSRRAVRRPDLHLFTMQLPSEIVCPLPHCEHRSRQSCASIFRAPSPAACAHSRVGALAVVALLRAAACGGCILRA